MHKAHRNRLSCCAGEDSSKSFRFTTYKICRSIERCFHKNPKWEFQSNHRLAWNGKYTPSTLRGGY